MNEAKKKRLLAKGWRVGSVQDFLGLSDAEAALIELKLKLAKGLRSARRKKGLGQVKLAEILHSSQSRIAKMEAGDASVSLDLLVRSHLALGATDADVGRLLAAPRARVR